MRTTLVVWWCLCSALVVRAQAPPAVTLDVVVDDAALKRPLTAADFVVTEAGRSLAIRSARLTEPAGNATPLPAIAAESDEAAVAAQADRLVGIYVDEYHLRDDAAWAATRAATASFLRTSLGPRDLVLVVKPLDSLVSLHLSTDRDAAARIIESASPRQGDYTPRSEFERNFFAGAPARLDVVRNQIALSAISALAAHLGQFPAGRKTLLVISNGVAGAPAFRREGSMPDAIVRDANMTHVAIYALRPSPPPVTAPGDAAVADTPGARDVLAGLAAQTTGLTGDGASDVETVLQRALRDASRYYLLALEAEPPPGGRMQAVSVSLRGVSAQLRARSAFGQPLRETYVSRIVPPPLGLSLPRHTSTLVRTWFGQSATDADSTTVTFVWEPSPRVPGGRGATVVPARVSMSVTLLDGTPVFEGTTGPSGRGPMLVPGNRPELVFTAKPGPLLVQMDVLDPAGRVLDHDVRDLTVTSFNRAIGFGTAALFRGRSQRDVAAIVNDPPTVAPVAAREFSRAEQLVVRVPFFSRGGAPDISARLQSRFGAPVRDVPTTLIEGPGRIVQIELPLASLASGAYSLVLTAHNSLGSVVESVDFGVTP